MGNSGHENVEARACLGAVFSRATTASIQSAASCTITDCELQKVAGLQNATNAISVEAERDRAGRGEDRGKVWPGVIPIWRRVNLVFLNRVVYVRSFSLAPNIFARLW